MKTLDFRSDTVTRPTREMREAMAAAEVGDDVYGDDPTVNELQRYAAELLGTEDSLYVCSGTMGNLLSILSACDKGDGALIGTGAHIWIHEAGGIACLAGVMPYPLDDSKGLPTIESIKAAYRAPGDVHVAPTTYFALENTHNEAGGLAIDVDSFASVADYARGLGLWAHLDGARLFNACAYYGVAPNAYASHVDSIQICLSKGLAAPMGSMLCGPKKMIDKARCWRKRLGGGQRQTGVAAAAGLLALREMRSRLTEDHENAALLAKLLSVGGLAVEHVEHRTNMVYFALGEGHVDEIQFEERCRARGLLLNAAGTRRVRMVTHINVDEESVKEGAKIALEEVAA